MSDFAPHTDDDVNSMLEFLNLDSIAQLFDSIPRELRNFRPPYHRQGISETDLIRLFVDISAKNNSIEQGKLVCFAGGGAYDHVIPAVTRSLSSQSGFVTSYTPYQAEVSQGVLQALFEFQSLVSRLAGLPVANASLYDGASACAEAVRMAAAVTGRHEVWVSDGLNPNWRQVLSTYALGADLHLIRAPLEDGVTAWDRILPDTAYGLEDQGSTARSMKQYVDGSIDPPAAVVVAYPNYLGNLEDMDTPRIIADATGAVLIVAFDPIAAALLRSAGEWGADVAVAEGQCLGVPLSYGGPYLGLFACKQEYIRKIPGRVVGRTVDTDGRVAYTMTLRTREQDIRRERATSNICTNQALMAVTAAIQLSWLGTYGLREVAIRCVRGARYLRELLSGVEGIGFLNNRNYFREFAVTTPLPAREVVDRMIDHGFLAGIPLDPELANGDDHALLMSVTEKRTAEEIQAFVRALQEVLA
ncbi:MAG: aminomethyl-transferring glycine dehydrogenase subunit GcvPA [Actinobacteria bacterium]|jgi:glycine dehydrogenase subunit 1|nr:aminomethyl-transferring glycine dehydrogenase subunit GcvPA [Actinomycetota bacterium]MCL6094226.1 aminomethyl-transferring glycine dehydrogenase subunit GcvPA [Actinomycetota bacterium]